MALWHTSPQVASLGLPSQRAMVMEQHPTWQLSERRFRRIRQIVNDTYVPQIVRDNNGNPSTVAYVHSSSPTQLQIDPETGEEFSHILALGVFTATGRKFRRDDTSGEWVLL